MGTQPGGYFHWTLEPWTADEKPFELVKREIDDKIAAGQKRSSLVKSYQQLTQERPTDVMARFAWAFAAFRNYSHLENGQTADDVTRGVRVALEEVPSPHSYEYARMRWFFHEWDMRFRVTEEKTLRALAARLLKRNPNDFDLKYTLAYDLAYTTNSVQEQDMAYRWAQEYLSKFPERSSSYYLMGSVMESRFDRFKRRSLADSAIGYFKKYETMVGKDSPYYKAAEGEIRLTENAISNFRRAKILIE